LWRSFSLLPRFLRKAIHATAESVLAKRHSYLALDYIRRGVADEELFWGGAVNFTETHKKRLLKKLRDGDSYPHAIVHQWHQKALANDPNADYLKRMIYAEFKNRLPELLLMRVDKVAMATSVEARVPFLDHRLVEYSMTIPQVFKIKNGEPKYILKKAVEGLIPDNIIYRKKQGFAAPISEWLRTEWSGYLRERVGASPLMDSYFRRDFVTTLMNQHHQRRIDAGQNLWNLLNLVLWYDYWIDGKAV